MPDESNTPPNNRFGQGRAFGGGANFGQGGGGEAPQQETRTGAFGQRQPGGGFGQGAGRGGFGQGAGGFGQGLRGFGQGAQGGFGQGAAAGGFGQAGQGGGFAQGAPGAGRGFGQFGRGAAAGMGPRMGQGFGGARMGQGHRMGQGAQGFGQGFAQGAGQGVPPGGARQAVAPGSPEWFPKVGPRDPRPESAYQARPEGAAFNDHLRQMAAQRANQTDEGDLFAHTPFWNTGYWQPTTQSQEAACVNLMELLLSFLPARTGSILDVGCGRGGSTGYLLRDYPADQITGINISPEQLALCRERLPQIAFLEMDAAALTFPNDTFDTVLCVEAMSHFNTRAAFLTEALRVLKPGGYLVFADLLQQRDSTAQPVENYLESADDYTALALAAGFARAEVYDAGEEAWNRFAKFHLEAAIAKAQTGEAPPRQVAVLRGWLNHSAPVTYVVGWMRKAG